MRNKQLPPQTRYGPPLHVACGFTLIELLVVITIIILLMAILLPALAYAKKRAYITATTTEMKGLATSCDTYFSSFGSYPGLYKDSDLAALATGSSNVSGSQNLYLSLMGAVLPTAASPTTINTPGGGTATETASALQAITVGASTAYYVPGNPGPNDYTPVNGSTNIKQWPVWFQPATHEIAYTSMPSAGAVSITSNPATTGAGVVPVFVDHFPDALPILYYRRSPGVDGTVASYPVTASSITGGTLGAAYYTGCNNEYTGTKITAISGSVYDNSATFASGSASTPFGNRYGSDSNAYSPFATAVLNGNSNTINNLQAAVTNLNLSSTQSVAVGSYVLIAAGPSRYYGSVQPSGSPYANDNIVVMGP